MAVTGPRLTLLPGVVVSEVFDEVRFPDGSLAWRFPEDPDVDRSLVFPSRCLGDVLQ